MPLPDFDDDGGEWVPAPVPEWVWWLVAAVALAIGAVLIEIL